MKKFDAKKEFMRMQKMYDNDHGIHDRMDLVTFAWNYYDNQIKKFEELRNFWTPKELQKFLEPERQKKKVVVRVKKAK